MNSQEIKLTQKEMTLIIILVVCFFGALISLGIMIYSMEGAANHPWTFFISMGFMILFAFIGSIIAKGLQEL